MVKYGQLIGGLLVVVAAALVLLTAHSQAERAPLTSTTFIVNGMTCGSCSESIRTAVGRIDGVDEVQVDVAVGRTLVRYDARRVDPTRIAAVISAAGYPARIAAAAATAAKVSSAATPAAGCACCASGGR